MGSRGIAAFSLALIPAACGSGGGGGMPDGAADTVVPMCIEDRFEENDECLTPTPPGMLPVGMPVALGLCGDEDWFEVRLAAGMTMTVRLTHDPTRGDIDLEIVNGAAGCAPVTASANAGAPVEMVTTTGGTGLRCIRVFGRGGALVENDYTLEVTIN